jgi:hypothetical protein
MEFCQSRTPFFHNIFKSARVFTGSEAVHPTNAAVSLLFPAAATAASFAALAITTAATGRAASGIGTADAFFSALFGTVDGKAGSCNYQGDHRDD